ncbi:phosphoserine aminotransferase [Aspergillus eucalypticola CBS 122712]|uniref:phosphoserine transaminase n=1 Tax=Aspergillus eucalypticola (strain CBS 122712 / IBT 29274) TaxID=1448314 RepID=A0A317UMV7_ASPEC|nr:phosphoserine aminotransferase [Aspergillus eucalypticola CBS 122712]PWY61897.1 phosphoserine aminotransferase [Aspergillus eucalypticola CBS 122712]
MKREDITYLGAGPASLPTDVLATAAQALQNYQDTGLGVAEHSHRSEIATNILNGAKADLANFLDIPDTYEILFLQGGGSGQFDATVYNLVSIWAEKQRQQIIKEKAGISEDEVISELRKKVESELKLDYLVTGSWSLKASQEAVRLLGSEYVNIVSDSRTVNDGKFGKIADESTWKLSRKAALVYKCENETVDGVEFPSFPKVLEPKGTDEDPIVVGDFSSTILSRRIPVQNYSIIFFGAQKNLGVAGITGVIIKKDLLPPVSSPCSPAILRKLGLPIAPTILDYSVAAKNNSLYNTLPIFDVYIAGQVLKKLLASFPDKVDGQQAVADRKAKLIYETLDAYPEVYKVVPAKEVRSRMNACFRVIKGGNVDDAEKAFLKGAVERGITGLKGHRSVGGIRASNYNAIPESGIEKLAAYLKDNFTQAFVVHNRMSHVKKLHLPRPTAGIKTDVWNLPNEIESQIKTLAAVLQVQQQQCTPLEREEEEDEEETDDEETSNEQLHNHELGSSAVVAPLALEDTKNLKRCFLDQLAELLCYKKDAHYVTCTYLREGLDGITILASRNAAWKDKDIRILESLAGTLEQLAARDPFDLEFKPDLERELSEYYTPRLNYHVKQLVNTLEAVKGETGLVDFLRDFLSRRISSQVLVDGVKRIWANIDFRSRIEVWPKANKIVQELGFIRRPIVAAKTFDKAAREISNFQRVKIELLPGYKAESVTPSLSLVSRTPQYLGISKKTCFMCGHFLQSLSQFQTRNNHGKVYSQWRLPKSLIMPPKYCETLDNAARSLRDVMQRERALELDYHIAAVKESTISSPVAPQHMRIWSPFSRHVPDPKLQARESEWLSHRSPREIAAFGILYFTSAADQQRLFGLYCHLVNDWGVGEEELRDAWQQDKLKEFFLFRSSQIPSTWIHNESHWISQQDGFAANKETDFNIVFESQKHVLKHEDQQVPYQLWKPREKLEAYVFLCQIRNGYIPDADEDDWISLGFCTARNGGETQQVAKLYRELLDTCVFEEFWKAMAESKMVDLFRKYGLGDAIAEMRNFETLLSAVGTWHQSCYCGLWILQLSNTTGAK